MHTQTYTLSDTRIHVYTHACTWVRDIIYIQGTWTKDKGVLSQIILTSQVFIVWHSDVI